MTARTLAAPAWALLAIFVIYASAGTWLTAGPRIWAPIHLSWPDVLQNILLYLPFGVFGVLTLDRRRSAIAAASEVALLAAGFSLIVEIIQLQTVDRTASLTDVLAAPVGAGFGGLAASRVARLVDAAIAAVRATGLLDAADAVVVLALVAALTIWAWWPFDPTLDVSTMATRLRAVRRDPWQVHGMAIGAHALLYGCLSFGIAAGADKLRTVAAMGMGVGGAVAVALILDAGQLAMGSRAIGLAGLGAQVAGATMGGALFALARVPK